MPTFHKHKVGNLMRWQRAKVNPYFRVSQNCFWVESSLVSFSESSFNLLCCKSCQKQDRWFLEHMDSNASNNGCNTAVKLRFSKNRVISYKTLRTLAKFVFFLVEWVIRRGGVGISIIGIAMWEGTVGLDSSSDCHSRKKQWYLCYPP